MDNNDSNNKSPQTGGLKLMTVFIAVLALHVLVIGGFTVYHLMSGGSTDADLTTTDKTHKSSVTTDGTSTDASQPDKSAPTTGTTSDVASAPANPPSTTPAPASSTSATPSPDATPDTTTAATAPTPAPAPAPAPTPAPIVSTPNVPTLAPPPDVANLSPQTATGPISITPDLGAPAESAPALSAPASPVAPLAAGPVHMPPAVTSTQTAPKPERAHGAIYTVKITDSYKKIAQAHHITVAELKEANHIKGNVLHTGQKLIIPSGKTDAAETANIPASTPAQAVNTSLTGTDMSEPTAVPAATTSLAETPHAHVYTVVKGDTLVKIAHRFKTTTTALMEENNISDPTKLAIGKKLKIPSRESRSARNVTPPSTTQPSQVQAKETTPTEENTPSGQLANFVP